MNCLDYVPWVNEPTCGFEEHIPAPYSFRAWIWSSSIGLYNNGVSTPGFFHQVGATEQVHYQYLLIDLPGKTNDGYRVNTLTLKVRHQDGFTPISYPVGVTLYAGTGYNDDTEPTGNRQGGDPVIFNGVVPGELGVNIPTFTITAVDSWLRLWAVVPFSTHSPPIELSIHNVDITLLYCKVLPPKHCQPVIDEYIGTGDGVTTTFLTDYPYLPLSLNVEVDGIAVGAFESDPAFREFTLSFTPAVGEIIRASYQGAG